MIETVDAVRGRPVTKPAIDPLARGNNPAGLRDRLLCLGAGLLFGNIPVVKNNFSLVTIGIVAVSMLPMAFEFLSHRRQRSA